MSNLIDNAFSRWLSPKPAIAKTPEEATTKVTAALSLDDPHTCPYCKGLMKPAMAAGIDVLICDKDRHVAPQPNPTEGT